MLEIFVKKLANLVGKTLEISKKEQDDRRTKILFLSFGLFGAIRGQQGLFYIEPPEEVIIPKQVSD